MKWTRFATYAWAVLAYNLGVILWGAYVRASGSGAGCGSHWPLCNGEVIPRAPQVETLVELSHRVTSGVALLLVVGLVVWAVRAFPKRHRVRRAAWVTLLFILTEAAVGAGLVLFELVADNASVARAMFMSAHLVNTFLLLAAITVTAWWASGGEALSFEGRGSLRWALAFGLLGTLVLGVSGAVAALGDTLFPARTLFEGLSQDLSPTAHALVRLRLLHPLIAVLVSAYLLGFAALSNLRRPGLWVRRFGVALAALIITQVGAGLLNVALLAPVWMQLVHLLLADFVWVAFVLLASASLAKQAEHTFETVNETRPLVREQVPTEI